MLLTFTSAIVYLAVRDFALENVPLGFLREVWKEWELRLITMLSLSLQFLLVCSGRLRSRYMGKFMLHVTITAFLTYQLANYAATVVLSALMRGPVIGNSPLAAIWTPFFLSHLGSPYNITAFSLEDNDLWRRYLFGAIIHVFQAVYICLRFGTDFKLKMIAVPVLITGIIRYGEKIWALRSASTSNLMTYISSSQQIMVIADDEHLKNRPLNKKTVATFVGRSDSEEMRLYRRAYLYFSAFRRLFSDLPLYTVRRDTSVEAIDLRSGTPEDAFRTVEMELEYLYDVLYTKTPIRLMKWGTASYVFCLITMVCSVIGFTIVVLKRRYFVIRSGETLTGQDLGRHPITDILITYMLFLGAIVLDVLSGLHHVQSNWAAAMPQTKLRRIYDWLARKSKLRWMFQRRRIGDRKVAQLDLFTYSCFKLARKRFSWLVDFLDTENLTGIGPFTTWEKVDPELKILIFDYLKHKHDLILLRFFDFSEMVKKEAESANINVEYLKDLHNKDFVRCVFVFHIATNLLYYDDRDRYPIGTLGKWSKRAKTLSDYMSYLAMVRPYMFPKGINEEIRIDTDLQTRSMFHKKTIGSKQGEISRVMKVVTKGLMTLGEGMGQVGPPPPPPEEVKNESALGDGIMLARILQELVIKGRWDHEQKWELVANLWVRMMVYAAELCPWKEHAKQLPNGGGEFLTHVSLILAHLHLATDLQFKH